MKNWEVGKEGEERKRELGQRERRGMEVRKRRRKEDGKE